MKKKKIRGLIILECIECKSNLKKRSMGVSRYYTQKNRRSNPEQLKLKKYCPYCNKTIFHKEIK